MPPNSELARQWFVPGEGIDRHVIVTDIQRYLGNDATVRPGKGTGENEGITGYWIKAYRNLTTAMIADLRADSARWRQEQRMPGTRDYVGSNTYHNSQAARVPRSRDGDSPALEAPYGSSVPSSRAMPVDRMPIDRMPVERTPTERIPVSRMPVDRMPMDRMDDRMQIDPPSGPPQDRRYPNDRNGGYPLDPRYGADPRGFPDSRTAYPQEQASYGRAPPVTSSYSQEPVYPRSGGYASQPGDGAPPGYVRQGNYYVPVSSADSSMRPEPSMYGGANPYGQSLQPQRSDSRDPRDHPRDPRDMRDPRDPRYTQDYPGQDPRYAYPSPAATTASLPRERESVTSPPQQSPYGSVPTSYDAYGGNRPAQYPQTPGQSGQSQSGQKYGSQQPSREPNYGRERPAPPTSSDSARTARRRLQ